MPKIYVVYDGGDFNEHFLNRKDAERAAKAMSKGNKSTADIELCTFGRLDLKLFIEVLNSNGGGWAETQELVARFTNGKKETIP